MNEKTWTIVTEKSLADMQLAAATGGVCSLDIVHVDNIEERARLIAAAPELLAACKRISEAYHVEQSWPTPDEMGTLRDAIAKAEGN